MLRSMTGFSRVQTESELGILSVELKAVNSRYLDIFFRLPESLRGFENQLRQQLSQSLARGKIDCSIRFQATIDSRLCVNQDYVEALLSASSKLAETHGITPISVGEIFRLPGVLVEKAPDSEALKTALLGTFQTAIDQLIEQREHEGQHLKNLIRERLDSIEAIVSDAKNNYHLSTQKINERLHDKLAEIAQRYQSQIDEPRFEQEMVYLLQKMDVAEELDRLQGHITAVQELLNSQVPVGRKLDFLMQEMNRESNTLASKAQHLDLTLNAVELKVLLEQMREQIQNIE